MRIYGNRQLQTLPGLATRPTSARVREAIFNIWQSEISGCHWLDLCAGNGSMGAEALCRGAKEVIGIEQSARACKIIQQNWQKFSQPQQKFTVLRGDVRKRLATLQGQQFDRIYFDPPYASELYRPVLDAIAQLHLLHPTAELAVEHNPSQWQTISVHGLEIVREKVYGNTAVTFYEVKAES